MSEHTWDGRSSGWICIGAVSVLVRMTETGEPLETVRIANDAEYLRAVMARAGEAPEVVLEATYGWYWAADALAELGAHRASGAPAGGEDVLYRRVKNDERDAADLADLLRMGRLPEAWIAPPATRELRGWVRHRAKLVALRSCLKNQVHAVLAHAGVAVPMSDLFGPSGRTCSPAAPLVVESRSRVDSAAAGHHRAGVRDRPLYPVGRRAAAHRSRVPGDPGIPGIGPVLVSRGGSRFTVGFRDDGVGVLGPDEGLAAFVPAVDECGDGLDQLADRVEGAAADGLAGDDPEEDLDHVQPGPGGRGEVQRDPRVAGQPGRHRGVFVGGVVVAHHVQLAPAGRPWRPA